MGNERDKPKGDRFFVKLVDCGLSFQRFLDGVLETVHVRDDVRGEQLE